MSWNRRIGGENYDQPLYSGDSYEFTIKMHHSGEFYKLGNKWCYVDGKEDFIDGCSGDEMSLFELGYMATEIGQTGSLVFYYSKAGVDECEELVELKTDSDTIVMCNHVNNEKIVGVFVSGKHMDFSLLIDENGFPDVDEPLPYMGYRFEESSDSEGERSVGEDSIHSLLYDSEGGCYDEDYKVDPVDVHDLVEQLKAKGKKPWEIGENEKFPAYSGAGTRLHNGKKVFNPATDMKEVILEKDMCFATVEQFRDAVRKHSVDNGRCVTFPTNCPKRVQVKCVVPSCPFYVFASTTKDDPTLQIRVIHFEHDCLKKVKTHQADTKFIVKQYGDKIKRNPKWDPKAMLAQLNDDCEVLFHQKQIYRAKRKVALMDCGEAADQFKLVRRYGKEILKSNPGSTVKLKTRKLGDLRYFKRIYICFGALKAGMLDGCRRIILLDGCHIRTDYGGVILTALGIDANNSMYPFAYAVVEKEKEKSWLWFLNLVKEDLNITKCEEWMIMSDKQKGLIKAVSTTLHGSEHRYCVMHLYSNFKQKHKGLPLKDLLWKAARSTREADFERTMEEIKVMDIKAYEWLRKRPPQNWCKAFFKTHCKTDLLLNNLSESFNGAITKQRMMPILWMLEGIRIKIMEQTSQKKQKMQRFRGNICPRIVTLYEKNLAMSTEFGSHWNGHEEFNVQRHEFGTTYKVLVPQKTCSCNRWQLTGIPCAHAIVALLRLGRNPEEYIDPCYSRDTYLQIYSHYLMPIGSMDEWPVDEADSVELLPPVIETQPGRPKEYKRTKQQGEKKGKIIAPSQNPENSVKFAKSTRSEVQLHCTICREGGHNSRKCPKKPSNWVKPDRVKVIPAANNKKKGKEKQGETSVPRPGKLPVRRMVDDWLNYGTAGGGERSSQPNPVANSNSQPISTQGLTSGLTLTQGRYSRIASEAMFSKKPI